MRVASWREPHCQRSRFQEQEQIVQYGWSKARGVIRNTSSDRLEKVREWWNYEARERQMVARDTEKRWGVY